MDMIESGIETNALKIVVDVLFGGPSDKMKLLLEALQRQNSICDMRFMYNFKLFFDEGNFNPDQLRKFSEKLEEQGNKEHYAMMILAAIDSIESAQKARCIANLTQSVIHGQIDTRKYLRLLHTLKLLIEEDIKYLDRNIQGGTLIEIEHLDDYLVYGILRQVDGGYAYTERAHDLVEHGIKRGHSYHRPSSIPQREIISIL